jgi:hypothetical protein
MSPSSGKNLLSWAQLIELVLEIGIRSISWAQLCRFLPEDGDRIQSPKRYVLINKKRMMTNVQKHNNFINIPSSQTFRSYLPDLLFENAGPSA